DRVADAAVHAQPAGWDHKMYRVAGKEYPALPIAVSEKQILPPWRARKHLVLHRHGDRLLEHDLHVVVAVHDGMQGEMTGGILHDQECRMGIGNVIMPPFADRDAVEQIVATIKPLPQLQQIGLTLKIDAELATHIARTTVAADEILSAQFQCCFAAFDLRAHAPTVLFERNKFTAVADIDARQALCDRLKQRL